MIKEKINLIDSRTLPNSLNMDIETYYPIFEEISTIKKNCSEKFFDDNFKKNNDKFGFTYYDITITGDTMLRLCIETNATFKFKFKLSEYVMQLANSVRTLHEKNLNKTLYNKFQKLDEEMKKYSTSNEWLDETGNCLDLLMEKGKIGYAFKEIFIQYFIILIEITEERRLTA